jgi:hypothetical protein
MDCIRCDGDGGITRGRKDHGQEITDRGYVLQEKITAWFGERLVPFDLAAAQAYAKIVFRARRRGHPLRVADAQIAAIAAARRFRVATRDAAPFIAAGVPVINPWTVGDVP